MQPLAGAGWIWAMSAAIPAAKKQIYDFMAESLLAQRAILETN
jgi:hypothetical protein